MKTVLEILCSLLLWGGLLGILGWTIYTEGFTESVIWTLSGLGCVVLSFLVFALAEWTVAGGLGVMFANMVIWSAFIGASVFRLIQRLIYD